MDASSEIQSAASRTSEKPQPPNQNNIISPVKFLSQRKKPTLRQVQTPFEIKAINYIPETTFDDNILSRNGGHEIDVNDFTNQNNQDEEMENIDRIY